MEEKRFRIGLNGFGILLFTAVMLPNILWYYFSAGNDPLRIPTSTVMLDTIAMFFQAVFVFFMCLLVDNMAEKPTWRHPRILAAFALVLLYYLSWALYYFVTAHMAVILALAVLPCLAFLAVEAAYQNRLAAIPTVIFLVLHTMSSAILCLQIG